jgi:hypothetical protein
MNNPQQQVETLQEIRTMMERSVRFRSLSSLTGWLAGLFALCGIAVAWWHLDLSPFDKEYVQILTNPDGTLQDSKVYKLLAIFTVVFLLSAVSAFWLARKRAEELHLPSWDSVTKRMIFHLVTPMVAGGIFCLSLLQHGFIALLPPASLIFYGLGLINASKYTLDAVRYIGFFQLVLGLIFSFYPGYGILGWGIGFGLVHILYGIYLNKSKRN